MFPVIDITGWEYEDVYVSGSKEKRWYRLPDTGKLVLFKLPVSLTSDTWQLTDESTGEMWAEKIASEIGNILGYSTHRVDIASIQVDDEIMSHYGLNPNKVKQGLIYGALCHSFLNEGEDSLVEGADMIMEFDYTYDRENLRGSREIYSYELLVRLFNKYRCINELYKMVVFDTLIGNTDRHQDNFGIIHNARLNRLTFAPLYDNSSCLGRELSSQRISLMQKDNQMFQAYLFGKKASSQIKWGDINGYEKLNMFELLRKVMTITPDIKSYISKVSILNDSILEEIVYKVPIVVMSDVQKEFVVRLIKTRRDYMLREFY